MGLFERLANACNRTVVWLFTGNSQSAISQTSNPELSELKFTPKIGTQRLKLQSSVSNKFFTSDLSSNEYLLASETGFEPIGVVMGTCFYKVGFYGYFRGYQKHTGELEALTQAQLAARELAVQRMQEEAAMLGACGIIGVRLQQSRQHWGIGTVEFTAIGTAIRLPLRSLSASFNASKPFTSDLSGQEFWQLYQAGYLPKGLVFGACSYYVHSNRQTRSLMNKSWWNQRYRNARQNQEMIQFSEGFQASRDLAVARLSSNIEKLGATRAVGMHIQTDIEKIDYQPFSTFWLWFFGLLFVAGLFQPIIFAIALFVFIPFVIFYSVISSLLSFLNPGLFRDLLANFVAVGTAIAPNQEAIQNPVSKALLFIPLSKS